jgi:hypothetical protein
VGRLRELLDELQARQTAATATADAQATDDWLSEGGAGSPEPDHQRADQRVADDSSSRSAPSAPSLGLTDSV